MLIYTLPYELLTNILKIANWRTRNRYYLITKIFKILKIFVKSKLTCIPTNSIVDRIYESLSFHNFDKTKLIAIKCRSNQIAPNSHIQYISTTTSQSFYSFEFKHLKHLEAKLICYSSGVEFERSLNFKHLESLKLINCQHEYTCLHPFIVPNRLHFLSIGSSYSFTITIPKSLKYLKIHYKNLNFTIEGISHLVVLSNDEFVNIAKIMKLWPKSLRKLEIVREWGNDTDTGIIGQPGIVGQSSTVDVAEPGTSFSELFGEVNLSLITESSHWQSFKKYFKYDYVSYFKKLTHLKIKCEFNSEIIKFLDQLDNLTHLSILPHRHLQSSIEIKLPNNLIFLKSHLSYIFSLKHCNKLTHLFYHEDISIIDIENLSNITHLSVINYNDFDFTYFKKLEYLRINSDGHAKLPENLKYLLINTRYASFNMPSQLIHLELTCVLESIEITYLPESLKYVIIPHKYESLVPKNVKFVKLF